MRAIQSNNFSHTGQEYGFSLIWVRSWLFKLLTWVNDFSQTGQKYGFSPVWVRSWHFKLLAWLNDLSTGQEYGLSPVWNRIWHSSLNSVWLRLCWRRLSSRLKDLSQTEHLNNFSLRWLWEREFCLRAPLSPNDLLQTVHMKGFSPVWFLLFFSSPRRSKTLLPFKCVSSLVWVIQCCCRVSVSANDLWQTEQDCFLIVRDVTIVSSTEISSRDAPDPCNSLDATAFQESSDRKGCLAVCLWSLLSPQSCDCQQEYLHHPSHWPWKPVLCSPTDDNVSLGISYWKVPRRLPLTQQHPILKSECVHCLRDKSRRLFV